MLLKLRNIYLIVYLLFTYIFCFIYLFYLFCCYRTRVLQNSGKEKGLWNNLRIVLKKLNEAYSDEMTNVLLKEARLLNDLRH